MRQQHGTAEPGAAHGHIPVLLAETIDLLRPQPGGVFVDGTVNGGGHSSAILQLTAPDGKLLALDADPDAVDYAQARFADLGERVHVRKANFRDLREVASQNGFEAVDGILLDLGFSSRQIDSPGRGLSFQRDDALDMRFDQSKGVSAAALVSAAPAEEIERLLRDYGEEPRARRVARAIADARDQHPIETTTQLADVVERALGRRHGRIHPATKTFQALRIAVNDELAALEVALPQAVDLLRGGGRLAVIAFHSLEDRIVKTFFRQQAGRERADTPRLLPLLPSVASAAVRLVTTRPVSPTREEVARNPRSRSARLRVVEKI
jgi:16S rRNA (cytosine1402-N4)-methyltransferase